MQPNEKAINDPNVPPYFKELCKVLNTEYNSLSLSINQR